MRILPVLVFLSVAALACANLKDIRIVEQQQQQAVPINAQRLYQRLYRPTLDFPCGLLGTTGSNTCVYHRLCISLAGILKSAGLLLLLRAAAVKYFHGDKSLKVSTSKSVLDSERVLAATVSQQACPHFQQVAHSTISALETCEELCNTHPSLAPAGTSRGAEQQQQPTPSIPHPATTPSQKGPGKVATVLTAFHIITTVSVKTLDHSPARPADDLNELCLPITASPPNTHLFTTAKFALSSALHRCFPTAPPPATPSPQQGWQVPPTPYLPINYDGVSLTNWASAIFCVKRHTRPPRPSGVRATLAATSNANRRACASVFPAEPVPELQPQHLTSAQAPAMTAIELVLMNRVLDAHLDDVTSCLFD